MYQSLTKRTWLYSKQASEILEQIGNEPNPTANQFYAQLIVSDLPEEDHEQVTLAAISIETMMNLDIFDESLKIQQSTNVPARSILCR